MNTYVPFNGLLDVIDIKPTSFRTLMGYDMDMDVWLITVALLGEEATQEYLSSLTTHVLAVRQFADKYYPEIGFLAAIHDHSKLSIFEFEPYARHFYGITYGADERTEEYESAWVHHYTLNPHHWQFWKGTDMPEEYVKEMLADWHGAAYAYTGKWDCTEWLNENWDTGVEFSPKTKRVVVDHLYRLGYSAEGPDGTTWVLTNPL